MPSRRRLAFCTARIRIGASFPKYVSTLPHPIPHLTLPESTRSNQLPPRTFIIPKTDPYHITLPYVTRPYLGSSTVDGDTDDGDCGDYDVDEDDDDGEGAD